VLGLAVVACGAVLGALPAGVVGAVIGASVSLLFAVPFALAVARGEPYRGSRGVVLLAIDATWSVPNTWAGALYYGVNVLRGNHHDVDRTRGAGSIWLVDGVFPGFATTIGTVKAGSSDRIDRHEELHVFQARLLGPLYLPLVGMNYVVATVVPYWLLFPRSSRRAVTGLSSYFLNGVYPHVWNELWAYRATRPAGA
jgi:hypothetical protein